MNNDLIHIIENFDFDNISNHNLASTFASNYMEKEIETLKNEHPQLYEKIIDILQEISDISNSCPQYASLVQYMIDERLKK